MKKRIGSVVIAAAVLAFIAACGGGDGSTSGNGTTGGAAQAKATDMALQTAFFSQEVSAGITKTITSGVVAFTVGKAAGEKCANLDGFTGCCTIASISENFDCTITDAFEGTDHVTGSIILNTTTNIATFTFDQTFTNFHPESDIVVNGPAEGTVKFDMTKFMGSTSAMCIGKSTGTDTSRCEETNPADIKIPEGCNTTDTACAESAATASFDMTLGSGTTFTLVDSLCNNNFEFSNFDLNATACFTNDMSSATLTLTTSGTLKVNSETIPNLNLSMTCDTSQM